MHRAKEASLFELKQPANKAEMVEILNHQLEQYKQLRDLEIKEYPIDANEQKKYQTQWENLQMMSFTLKELMKNPFFPEDQAEEVLKIIEVLSNHEKEMVNKFREFQQNTQDQEAHGLLKDRFFGSKLRRKQSGMQVSYIKGEKEIYAFGKLVARGSNKRKIKAIRAVKSQEHKTQKLVVKIGGKPNAGLFQQSGAIGEISASEIKILKDLKLIVDEIPRPDSGKIYIIMQNQGESLKEACEDKTEKELSLDERLNILTQASHQLQLLHDGRLSASKTQYQHGDIHSGNYTIDEKGHVRLCDFGFTTELKDTAGLKEDICSFSVILLDLFPSRIKKDHDHPLYKLYKLANKSREFSSSALNCITALLLAIRFSEKPQLIEDNLKQLEIPFSSSQVQEFLKQLMEDKLNLKDIKPTASKKLLPHE